jgi:predicted ATPase
MVAADWGEIWLDNEVGQRATSHFQLAYLGERVFKGFADPQPVYTLSDKRDDTPQTFYESAFLGREQELAQLEAATQSLWDGRYAGVVTIVGEAGMGKSRLVYEFLQSPPISGRCRILRCQTDEILRDSLNPFRYALRHYLGQSSTQDEVANRQRFNHALDALIATTAEADLRADLERTRPFLAGLVGLRWQDSLIEQMAPELRAENTLIAIKTLFKAESLHQPVVIWLEDAHWLDGDSRAFLARLTRNVEAYPLLLLVTSREEATADWFDAAAPQQIIHLRPLDKDNAIALAELLLPEQALKTTSQLLAERADGNPYFVEQMALYLQEQRLVESQERETAAPTQRPETLTASTPLPADIRTILTARLDRLAPEVKEVVQRAAVLGREFDPQVLGHMLTDRPAVGGRLEIAAQEAIWYPVGDGNYLFKHALMRDAAYEMQLHGRLRMLHHEAAQAYEAVLHAIPNYGQIAYHYDKAEVVVKALDYYEKAADQAKENYQNEAALAHYGRALQLTHNNDAQRH